MMLANFFGYVLSLSKITYPQKSVRISYTFFVIYIYIYISIGLTYKCEKCQLFECFANAISLRLQKIILASFERRISQRELWRGVNIDDVTIHPSRGSRINPTLKVCKHNRVAHASQPILGNVWNFLY